MRNRIVYSFVPGFLPSTNIIASDIVVAEKMTAAMAVNPKKASTAPNAISKSTMINPKICPRMSRALDFRKEYCSENMRWSCSFSAIRMIRSAAPATVSSYCFKTEGGGSGPEKCSCFRAKNSFSECLSEGAFLDGIAYIVTHISPVGSQGLGIGAPRRKGGKLYISKDIGKGCHSEKKGFHYCGCFDFRCKCRKIRRTCVI